MCEGSFFLFFVRGYGESSGEKGVRKCDQLFWLVTIDELFM
ncbi:hypothetical protein BAOM_3986 [Peribacillus asahii]|uniref:Uncharacterized protein n=1 Tax=Peribacillus asahii TaxID=228899 RepID=A0A3Q9RRJ4_9BACI|nr:hypothetical protein BAOM_3986 [Peribacillus asahii]